MELLLNAIEYRQNTPAFTPVINNRAKFTANEFMELYWCIPHAGLRSNTKWRDSKQYDETVCAPLAIRNDLVSLVPFMKIKFTDSSMLKRVARLRAYLFDEEARDLSYNIRPLADLECVVSGNNNEICFEPIKFEQTTSPKSGGMEFESWYFQVVAVDSQSMPLGCVYSDSFRVVKTKVVAATFEKRPRAHAKVHAPLPEGPILTYVEEKKKQQARVHNTRTIPQRETTPTERVDAAVTSSIQEITTRINNNKRSTDEAINAGVNKKKQNNGMAISNRFSCHGMDDANVKEKTSAFLQHIILPTMKGFESDYKEFPVLCFFSPTTIERECWITITSPVSLAELSPYDQRNSITLVDSSELTTKSPVKIPVVFANDTTTIVALDNKNMPPNGKWKIVVAENVVGCANLTIKTPNESNKQQQQDVIYIS